ncbi:MAG: carbohydrate porin, partial [Rhodothermaceae bacterium]|nr:carbohydrate porin [Rhodothermaceae bacterium]
VGFDFEKMAGMQGTSLFFHGQYQQGNGISRLAGDWQGISNVEAPDAVRLFQAWVEQTLFSGHGSILLGLYNLNTEFYALNATGLFVNNGFGIGGEFGRSGRNGPSIAPVTSLALRFAVQTPHNNYFMLGVLDGVPGDPEDITRTHISLSTNDGALVNAEGGYKIGDYLAPGSQYLKVGVGYWMYTAPQDEIVNTDERGVPSTSKGNRGWYVLMESTVFNESQNTSDGLTLYGRMGASDKTYNDIGFSWSAGLVYNGLIPGRSSDAVGLAITSIYAGGDFQNAASISGLQLQTAESVIEFTYKLSVAKWLTIQPDLQYVINPGLGLQADKTLAAGGRVMIGF